MVDQPASSAVARPSVAVLGGGVAGIAAALKLAEAGWAVTLAEARQSLGGRAFSFTDPVTGAEVDNGQHVILGCCSAFFDFINRLGAAHLWHLQPQLSVPVADRNGKVGWFKAAPLPAPFHLLPSFLAYPHLSAGDKIKALPALLRARLVDRSRPEYEDMTFLEWLRRQGQSVAAIARFWNLLVEPTLNDNVKDVSARLGLMLFQEGLFAGRKSGNLGYPRRGLTPALGAPASSQLSRLGVQTRLGCPVRCLLLDGERIGGAALNDGEILRADYYISALPFYILPSLLPAQSREIPYFRQLEQLETSPIVNVYLWYDRPVLAQPFLAFVDSPLQWVFDRSTNLGAACPDARQPAGQCLGVSLSAAWQYIGQPREAIARQCVEEVAQVFPAARGAKLLHSAVVKQRHATFRSKPGVNRIRPRAVTPIANLFLAGEWTDTGWPSTLESAVRSGYQAAEAALQAAP